MQCSSVLVFIRVVDKNAALQVPDSARISKKGRSSCTSGGVDNDADVDMDKSEGSVKRGGMCDGLVPTPSLPPLMVGFYRKALLGVSPGKFAFEWWCEGERGSFHNFKG